MKVRRFAAAWPVFLALVIPIEQVADPDCTGPSPGRVRAMLATLT